jgi:hypothetical protein
VDRAESVGDAERAESGGDAERAESAGDADRADSGGDAARENSPFALPPKGLQNRKTAAGGGARQQDFWCKVMIILDFFSGGQPCG